MPARRIFLAGLLVLLAGIPVKADTPDLRQWHKLSANGSRVIDIGRGHATFVIRRRARAAKANPLFHGYAYLLSGPVELPANWRHVEITGEWWRLPFKRNCYPELALRVNARYPRFSHGNVIHGAWDTNFIHIGYASWKPKAHYSDKGSGARAMLHGTAAASFPERPRGFMLSLDRGRDGRVSWSFFQRDGRGIWRRLFHVARSGLFEGVGGPKRIFVKVGGWNTWEYPVANSLRVRNLRLEISSWSEPDEGLPGNEELNEQAEQRQRHDLRKQRHDDGMRPRESHRDDGQPGEERMRREERCRAAPFVRNVTRQRDYPGVQAALNAAMPGDRIELGCGTYYGHFIIRRRVTLTSADGRRNAVLDGGGRGVVLRIRADGTVVSRLDVRHSGVKYDPYTTWKLAGIVVQANDVRLQALRAEENGNGISIANVSGVQVLDSQILNNKYAGLVLAGTRHCLVRNNRMQGNETGIDISPYYPGADELSALMLIPPRAGRRYFQALEQINRIMAARVDPAHNHIISNAVLGNGSAGISVGYAHHHRFEHNHVATTGMRRKPARDEAAMKFFMRLGSNLEMDAAGKQSMKQRMNHYAGAGMLFTCFAHDNRILANRVEDNLGHGVILDLVNDDVLKANLIRRNRSGILLVNGTRREQILENRVLNNREMGISIGDYQQLHLSPWPTDNLVARNDIADNGHGDVFADAYDASTTVVTEEQIRELIREAPWPAQAKEAFLRRGRGYRQMLRTHMNQMKPGHNRWDDGALGNHYSVFDEREEGFADDDGDGISERAFIIPGGSAQDHRPLSADYIRQLLPAREGISPAPAKAR